MVRKGFELREVGTVKQFTVQEFEPISREGFSALDHRSTHLCLLSCSGTTTKRHRLWQLIQLRLDHLASNCSSRTSRFRRLFAGLSCVVVPLPVGSFSTSVSPLPFEGYPTPA
jgi:hypothetical protein